MRRFSQRNSLVTLNEINITPLLDLAFVLLIIFVITRPLLEQSMDLKLPAAGKIPKSSEIDPKDVWVVEINANGLMRLKGRPMDLATIEKNLKDGFQKNPKMIVNIRGDKITAWDNMAKVMGACMRNGITRVSPQIAEEK